MTTPIEVPVSFIDTHCHLNHASIEFDPSSWIEAAQAAGVRTLVNVGFDLSSSRRAIHQAQAWPSVYAAIGVHPHDAANWTPESKEELRSLAQEDKVVAIGEIGLDYHYDFAPRHVQLECFRDQLILARSLGLPYVVHCREAYEDTLAAIREARYFQGVMHCWTADASLALEAEALGLMLGFGGAITFKKAESIREAVRAVNLDSILLETDAPYMTPEPYRGKPNQPALLPLVAQRLAEVRGISIEEVAAVTTRNASSFFQLTIANPIPEDENGN